ncbi:hypothetical protein A4D02_27745 [Niastella koreensis]|uniref:Yip1 domain-containing protein n=2 Tax=Niastella koreensis TaxID=354356 RepID=G8TI24_NIAKG|nr:DUF3667 domain-containing protein [Niastella koreensis]AEV99627.1 hypothetical protein Niako_3309 [Niastella koreensis GR20-10]OQP49873.1 hypothetical protein A4D02_27745 [Niastella koreensis]
MALKPEHNTGLKSMAHEALHDLVHFDLRLFHTIPALLFKPGKVTERSLHPGQKEYVRPFALFVFLNFLFFIVKSKGLFHYALDSYRGYFEPLIMHKAAELKIGQDLMAERFNIAMHFEQKEYFVIMVPLFALVLWLLYGLRRGSFALYLVFALNYYSFLIAFLILVPWFTQLFYIIPGAGVVIESESFLIGLTYCTCWLYLVFALKRVYQSSVLQSILRGAALSLTTLTLIVFVYRTLLFFIVLHSIAE